jgi:hypothetical protein
VICGSCAGVGLLLPCRGCTDGKSHCLQVTLLVAGVGTVMQQACTHVWASAPFAGTLQNMCGMHSLSCC